MRNNFVVIAALLGLLSTGCDSHSAQSSHQEAEPPELWQQHLDAVTLAKDAPIAVRESIYVPVYAHIYFEDRTKLLELTETVSIRNTDPSNPIILTAVKHYSTDGSMLKNYLASPVSLKPLATADFVVPRTDVRGGTGANFVVDWVAKSKVAPPIVESIMINAGQSHGISFLSRGVVIKHEEIAAKTK